MKEHNLDCLHFVTLAWTERFLTARVRDSDDVFSIDNLPDPHLLGCNTNLSDKPDRHWLALYIEDRRGEFFDSFGRQLNTDLESYMNRHCVSCRFNDKQLVTEYN